MNYIFVAGFGFILVSTLFLSLFHYILSFFLLNRKFARFYGYTAHNFGSRERSNESTTIFNISQRKSGKKSGHHFQMLTAAPASTNTIFLNSVQNISCWTVSSSVLSEHFAITSRAHTNYTNILPASCWVPLMRALITLETLFRAVFFKCSCVFSLLFFPSRRTPPCRRYVCNCSWWFQQKPREKIYSKPNRERKKTLLPHLLLWICLLFCYLSVLICSFQHSIVAVRSVRISTSWIAHTRARSATHSSLLIYTLEKSMYLCLTKHSTAPVLLPIREMNFFENETDWLNEWAVFLFLLVLFLLKLLLLQWKYTNFADESVLNDLMSWFCSNFDSKEIPLNHSAWEMHEQWIVLFAIIHSYQCTGLNCSMANAAI